MSVTIDYFLPEENSYFSLFAKAIHIEEVINEPLPAFDKSYIIFDYNGCDIKIKDEWVKSPKSYLKPVRDHYLNYNKPKKSIYYIAVLHECSFYKITGRQASDYQDRFLPLDEILGIKETEKLYHQVKHVEGIEAFVDLMHHFFEKHVPQMKTTPIDDIIKHIKTSEGLVSIDELLSRSKCSQSTLNRYFLKYVGVTTSLYIRLVKFNLLIRKISNKHPINDMICWYDYFDQSHLTKDFLRFANVKPADYLGPNFEILREVMKKAR
ncbi:helix-turn-helix domain-containing protein [Ekhidna sp.]